MTSTEGEGGFAQKQLISCVRGGGHEIPNITHTDTIYGWPLMLVFSLRCRVEEFIAIVPKQPYRPAAVSNEVRMEFEAVLLDGAQRERQNQLWIHAKIKACIREEDCQAVSVSKQSIVA